MAGEQHYETEWEGLRLVIEKRQDRWQVFVYDPEACEVLYAAERDGLEEAKGEAIGFAATHRFGSEHGLQIEILLQMLVWEHAMA